MLGIEKRNFIVNGDIPKPKPTNDVHFNCRKINAYCIATNNRSMIVVMLATDIEINSFEETLFDLQQKIISLIHHPIQVPEVNVVNLISRTSASM